MSSEAGRSAFGPTRPEHPNAATQTASGRDLDATLHRIVTATMTITGARYSALEVWAPDGALVSFAHAGMDPDAARMAGHRPVGEGVLGVLRERREPLRLTDLTEHPAAAGFPGQHPPMRAFLGVPVTSRGAVLGGLYVTDDRPGHGFGEDDETAVRAFASAASVAIDNARLSDRVRAAARWSGAGREIITTLLSGAGPDLPPLQLICGRAAKLAGAERAIALVPAEPERPGTEVDTLVVSAAVGRYAKDALWQRVPIAESTAGEVFRSGEPVITETLRCPFGVFTDLGEGSSMVIPLCAHQQTIGVIVLSRNAAAPAFDTECLPLVGDFAGHAAVALSLVTAREDAQKLSLLTDRERIARDLHDQVIQRIFAIGLNLQGVVGRLRSAELAARVGESVDELQAVIHDIRGTIFNLHRPAAPRRSFAESIRDAVARLTGDGDIATSLRMAGPMTAVSGELAEWAEAFLGEALGNAVGHSGATDVTITIGVGDEISIEVHDDGPTPITAGRRSALAALARRAEETGARCVVTSPAAGGTRVSWSATVDR